MSAEQKAEALGVTGPVLDWLKSHQIDLQSVADLVAKYGPGVVQVIETILKFVPAGSKP
jgi:hypothetical protein